MVCPNCNSSDVKRVSLIHAAGLYESRGGILAFLVGSGDDLLLGRYRGTSQSRLSKALSPPRKLSYAPPAILWLLGFFILMSFAVRGKLSWMMGALSVGYLLLLPAYLLVALLYNFFLRPKKYRDWNEEFICQQCGFHSRIRRGQTGVVLEPLNRESR
jgi:hypothetical protein